MNSTEIVSTNTTNLIDKKFLINEWRDTTLQKISGIYKIVHRDSGKYYIGSSKNIFYRWNRHVSALQKNKHHCSYLQRSWNKYGGSSFDFYIIKISTNSDLLIDEQQYLDIAKFEKNKCYNLKFSAKGGGNYVDEIKTKIANKSKERWQSKSFREKVSNAHKKNYNDPNFLKRFRESVVKCWTVDRRNKRSQLSKNNWDISKKWMGGKGSNHPRYDNKIYTFCNKNNNEMFTGTRYEFYNKFNLDASKVYGLINGKIHTHKGWIFIPPA